MKHLKSIFLALALTMVFNACVETGHFYITLMNYSGTDIGCQMLWSGHITEADSAFKCGMVTDYVISSDSLIKFKSLNEVWETDFKAIPYIQFLIMDGDFKQYFSSPCDTIRKYVPVLRRYQLTLSDLEQLHWAITYPPTEAMKGVKMYPPYKKQE